MLERGSQVAVVAFVVLALDRKNGDFVVLDQRRRHIVLSREGIRRAEQNVRAAGFESLHQIGRFSSHMQASREAHAAQRFFLLEPFLYSL